LKHCFHRVAAITFVVWATWDSQNKLILEGLSISRYTHICFREATKNHDASTMIKHPNLCCEIQQQQCPLKAFRECDLIWNNVTKTNFFWLLWSVIGRRAYKEEEVGLLRPKRKIAPPKHLKDYV